MAKKSAAGMSVVASIKPKDARLSPPASLTDRQKELWLEIVASKPADWFTVDAKSLLVGYVKAIASYETLATRIDMIESPDYVGPVYIKTEDMLYAMLERQARLVQSFATKMRLTQQARYTTGSAATATARAGKSRPWD